MLHVIPPTPMKRGRSPSAASVLSPHVCLGTMHPTPFPELNDVLRALPTGVQETPGSGLVGVYFRGSFPVGGFDQDSDVDFVTIVESKLSSDSVDALQTLYRGIFHLPSEWARHLAGPYFSGRVLRPLARQGFARVVIGSSLPHHGWVYSPFLPQSTLTVPSMNGSLRTPGIPAESVVSTSST